MDEPRSRLRINIQGAVQGVGFRPFVYRRAVTLGLAGWVSNSSQGVMIEAEGSPRNLDAFIQQLRDDKPPHAFIQNLQSDVIPLQHEQGFAIHHSNGTGAKTALILPDIATCSECLREIFDPANRRFQYPFTNCTHCGPRYSIITGLPYDRPLTTMHDFVMCGACRAEYENPLDRRFHAQPNACPDCGPQIVLWDRYGAVLAEKHDTVLVATDAIRQGAVLALKGLGGFQLIVDARNQDAVRRLREGKSREEKPFAVMVPSLEMVNAICQVSELESRLLTSPQAPIVLLRRRASDIAAGVAPENPYLGVMLPYTPLHYLLMHELSFPVVATSGNLSDEPICIDEVEALDRLRFVADVFLAHDRPIARHVDDSVVRVMNGRDMILRRARGYAPLPITVADNSRIILAVGGHLKNTIALAAGEQVFVSQHIGDLETESAVKAFLRTIKTLENLYDLHPEIVACDLHPDYVSAQFAESFDLPLVRVQHHYAHVLACMAEHGIKAPVLGVSWDGTGSGVDGTIWGGEFLRITDTGFERAAYLRTFALPGGEKAVKEPRRAALGLLYEIFGDALFEMPSVAPLHDFPAKEQTVLRRMLQHRINSPLTSSAGRLFDAVAALLDLRQVMSFEGQAAMELEFALDGVQTDASYPFIIRYNEQSAVLDWEPMIRDMLADKEYGVPVSVLSAKFHNTLAEMIVSAAAKIGENRIVLSGGCFQNQYLTERAIQRLEAEQIEVFWHQRIPPNDGGISLGQIAHITLQNAGRKEH